MKCLPSSQRGVNGSSEYSGKKEENDTKSKSKYFIYIPKL